MMLYWTKTLSATLLIGLLTLITPHSAQSEDWVMIELRSTTPTCGKPLECLGESGLILRNLLSIGGESRANLIDLLNQAAVNRDVPDMAVRAQKLLEIIPYLQSLERAQKAAPLRGLKHIYFDAGSLARDESMLPFLLRVRGALQELGIQELTEEEVKNVPGRPRLTIYFKAQKNSAGCIIPFFFAMSVKEEVVLVRDPSTKIETPIWSHSVREDLASQYYAPSHALEEAVVRFMRDYKIANPG